MPRRGAVVRHPGVPVPGSARDPDARPDGYRYAAAVTDHCGPTDARHHAVAGRVHAHARRRYAGARRADSDRRSGYSGAGDSDSDSGLRRSESRVHRRYRRPAAVTPRVGGLSEPPYSTQLIEPKHLAPSEGRAFRFGQPTA